MVVLLLVFEGKIGVLKDEHINPETKSCHHPEKNRKNNLLGKITFSPYQIKLLFLYYKALYQVIYSILYLRLYCILSSCTTL